MDVRSKTRMKHDRTYEFRAVYLTIAGKNLDPRKFTETLEILPDSSGKLGEPYSNNRKCKQGYWSIEGGPSTWRIETQMKNILKRIAPVKRQLEKLIKEDEAVREACLKICFELPKGIPNACYCFSAELINEFTSLGIDVALSIHVVEEWERIFAEGEAKTKSRQPSKAQDRARGRVG